MKVRKMNKRLIEVDFPLKEVSEESVREKSIRHGHISTLHIWWARRPLAASRATIFAALTPAPKNKVELKKKLDDIVRLSKWKNSANEKIFKECRKVIQDFHGGRPAKVLDCFAGGGSIPLEALRLGCETYALELNPVAVLILKAVLEYPQKYGRNNLKMKYGFRQSGQQNLLVSDVQRWSNWVIEEVRKEISQFYPNDPDGNIPVGYIWARTAICENPSCGMEIPLIKHLWLANTKDKRVILKKIVDKRNKRLDFRILKGKDAKIASVEGTTRKATALCPLCGSALSANSVRKQASEGKMGQRLIAFVLRHPHHKGKTYRVATERDLAVFRRAEEYLESKIRNWEPELEAVPNEPLSTPGNDARCFFVHLQTVLYGMSRWGDIFNSRQKLALITMVEKVRTVGDVMLKEGYNSEHVKAIRTYLALGVDWTANKNSSVLIWAASRESVTQTFNRHDVPMVWDYIEVNPFSGSTGSWESLWNFHIRAIDHCSKVSEKPAQVLQGTATHLPYPENFFDAVITDPPYYDNVPYADLSDFFYVWLKRSIGDLYPDLLSTPLTPKSAEIIQNSSLVRRGSLLGTSAKGIKNQTYFEQEMTKVFNEIKRVLKPEGIAVIVFAHKSTEAWESIINSLHKSGLVLSASWPIHTERKGRMRAYESATLASSIYMVCRKRTREEVAYFNEIKNAIEKKIKKRLTQFWKKGISGADFFVSAIGPAVEVFGKYSRVEKLSGEEVSVKELLEYVRKIVSEFALERVLKRADLGGVDADTRFYLLWRWTFNNAKVHFDDAIKLSRPMGIELTNLWDRGGFVKKEKQYVRVLDPKARAKDPAFLRKTKFTSMIDVLHHAVILWERGNKERIKEILDETGYAGNDIFWQTAQAISEVLPKGDKEKQLLQGFLYGKEVYVKEARGKRTLLDFVED